jgi:hypothetical protein
VACASVRKIDAYAIAICADLGPRQTTDLVAALARQDEKLDNTGVVAVDGISGEPHRSGFEPLGEATAFQAVEYSQVAA